MAHPVNAPAEEPPQPAKQRRSWPWIVIVVLVCAAGTAGYWAWSRGTEALPTGPMAQLLQARAVPVIASTARRGDLDLYVDGLGNVSAFNTVTVRPRVDGQLVNVAYTEGQHVKEGDLLVEIDPRPFQATVAQAEGQLAKDQALLENARRDLERFKTAGEGVTQQQIDTQAALVQQDEGIVKSDQAVLDNARLQLSYCRITAPITGRAGLRLVDAGNIVHATDPGGLVVLTQLQPIAVLFSIPQGELPRVLRKTNTGQKLIVDALSQDLRDRLATGSLIAIDNQVDQSTGTVRLKAEFANTDDVLFPNEFVNARLTVDTLREVVLVPAAAVQRGPSSTFVYVVKPDQTVEMRTVTLGPTEGEQTVIESGVAAGELVVTDGVDKLTQGSKVSVSSAATAPTRPAGHATGAASTHPSTRSLR
jgi:multidrug efflux system membrane fusion protein